MKTYKFDVYFTDGTGLQTTALTPMQAMIKMMAVRIQDGKSFIIDCIEDEDGKVYELANDIELKITKIV